MNETFNNLEPKFIKVWYSNFGRGDDISSYIPLNVALFHDKKLMNMVYIFADNFRIEFPEVFYPWGLRPFKSLDLPTIEKFFEVRKNQMQKFGGKYRWRAARKSKTNAIFEKFKMAYIELGGDVTKLNEYEV